MRPKGPRENSPGREPGGFITETSSPEGAAQNPCATWLLCRPFRALLFCRLTPGSRPGLISGRPFGARQRLEGRVSRQKLIRDVPNFSRGARVGAPFPQSFLRLPPPRDPAANKTSLSRLLHTRLPLEPATTGCSPSHRLRRRSGIKDVRPAPSANGWSNRLPPHRPAR